MKRGVSLIQGMGYNDADYPIHRHERINSKSIKVWACPYYLRWLGLFRRCYSPASLKRNPKYADCFVCDEWLYFSKFKSWMETQDWEGKELDKDILIPNNKIYGPDTCVFVTQDVNKFLIDQESKRGDFPVGVCFEKESGKYKAQCYSVATGKRRNLGRFTTPKEASDVYLKYKLEQAYMLAAKQTDKRVAKALVGRFAKLVEPMWNYDLDLEYAQGEMI